MPVFPFWLINLVSAFTSISTGTYVTATVVGMVPISFVWAHLGESLAHIDSPGDALSGGTLIALTVLGLVGLAAILGKNFMFGNQAKRKSA